jgi:predicted transcriptional regulator of viral defense system
MRSNLREIIPDDVFDYVQLTDALSHYGNVWGKIGRLLASGEIIRIKKGLYTFPEYLRKSPLNSCVIANMLYGPSYVSCDYALAYYGVIPEKVEVVTSMTTGRPREFATPVGAFAYFRNHTASYSIGIDCVESPNGSFLIAAREKALFDKALTDRRFSGEDVETYLSEDLRIELEELENPDRGLLAALRKCARGKMIPFLNCLEEI